MVVYLDAIYLTTRPSAVKERVRVGGRYDAGERVLLDICLGLRKSYEDWFEMGRGLPRYGLGPGWGWSLERLDSVRQSMSCGRTAAARAGQCAACGT